MQMLVLQRPEVIKIKAKDADGKPVRCTYDGWAARVFQHEFDHLQGVLFPDRMPVEEIEGEKDKLLALDLFHGHPVREQDARGRDRGREGQAAGAGKGVCGAVE